MFENKCPYSKLMQAGTIEIERVLNAIQKLHPNPNNNDDNPFELLLDADDYMKMVLWFVDNNSNIEVSGDMSFKFSNPHVCDFYEYGKCTAPGKANEMCHSAKIQEIIQNTRQ